MVKNRIFGKTEQEAKNSKVFEDDGFLSEQAKKMWEQEKGEELKPFPLNIDLTDYIGTVFKVLFKSGKQIEYEYEGTRRTSMVYLVTLLDTDNPTLMKLRNQDISIFGKGYLDWAFKSMDIKEGDKILLMCSGQGEMKGGYRPYQFRIKRIV